MTALAVLWLAGIGLYFLLTDERQRQANLLIVWALMGVLGIATVVKVLFFP